MSIPKQLALTDDQIDDIMLRQWNMRIASVGPGSRINLTPMWFGWAGRKLYFYGRGQKVVNLRRNPECSVIVDCNERFPELQGIMIQGKATVLEDESQESVDPHLAEVRDQMGSKYNGGHGPKVDDPPPNNAHAAGRSRRWVTISSERITTWDNFKLGTLPGRK